MQMQYKKYVLSIAYNNYQTGIGGVDKAIIAQKEKLYDKQISYLFLFPQLARIKKQYIVAHLWEVIADDKNLGLFTSKELIIKLLDLQKKGYQVVDVIIHHMLNVYFPDLYFLLDSISGKIQMVIHDYYTICPQYFLLKNDQKFCGREGYQENKCRSCKYYPAVKEHMKNMVQFFNDYKERLQLIFPSEYTERLWSIAYPRIKLEKRVIPHLQLYGEYTGNRRRIAELDRIKIAYIGQQLYLKGWNVWKKIYNKGLLEKKYISYYLGMGDKHRFAEKNIKVSFQKTGKDAMVQALRKQKIDCVILWSIYPETYSYTYYECLAANVFVITNVESGNIAAMVEKNENGVVCNQIDELIVLLKDTVKLKEQINHWRAEKKYGAKILANQKELFEIGKEIGKIKKENLYLELKEFKIKKTMDKIIVTVVKQIKKVLIFLFY